MHRWFGLLWVSVALAPITIVAAEKTPSARQSQARSGAAADAGKTKKPPKAASVFTPAREAAALAFVGRHHPELADLLTQLKKTQSGEYQRAIGALFRASERLAHIQERKPRDYEWELKAWKLRSRIQLLVAQLRITPQDERLRRELEQALTAQVDLRAAQLVEERERLAERLEKLDALIEQLRSDLDSQVRKRVEFLLRPKTLRGAANKNDRETTPPAPKRNTHPPASAASGDNPPV